MSKLNPRGQNVRKRTATSHNGNPQFEKTAAQQLFEMAVMTMIGKDSFYESNDERLQRMRKLMGKLVHQYQFDFIANTIVYARTEMNIRSFPIVMAVCFVEAMREQQKNYEFTRRMICDVIQRADQITDMYAFALKVFGSKKKVPLVIKRGVADALNKFDEYQFAKYNRKGEVSFKDVLRIVHPKPADMEQGDIFAKIMAESLQVPYTWETELSNNGQLKGKEQRSKAEVWTDLINSKRVGYMAMLRNLRNIAQAGVDRETVDKVARRLSNEEQVRRSKQLPFRFLSASKAMGHSAHERILRDSIEQAIEHSIGNLPAIGKNVWIVMDVSHSMSDSYASDNPVAPIETATLFAAAMVKAHSDACNLNVTMFSDRADFARFNRNDSVMNIARELKSQVYGGGTNLGAALDMKNRLGFEPDTIILFSDMQVNRLSRRQNKALEGLSCLKVAFNLDAYTSTPVSVIDGWYQLSGWSDRVFDWIPAMNERASITDIMSQPYFGDQMAD